LADVGEDEIVAPQTEHRVALAFRRVPQVGQMEEFAGFSDIALSKEYRGIIPGNQIIPYQKSPFRAWIDVLS
jgi:hypothetical protein